MNHYIRVPFINTTPFPDGYVLKSAVLNNPVPQHCLHVFFFLQNFITTSFRQALFQIHPILHNLQKGALPPLALIHSNMLKIDIHFSCQTGWMVI